MRLAMFAAMAAFLVAALCVPGAFGSDALLFACAYGVVRAAHIALFMIASREDAELRHSVLGLAASTAIGVGLLVAAAFVRRGTGRGALQLGLWGLALVLDIGGPYLFGIEGWKLVPGHFAERHGAIMIIALGESIVAIGVGARATIDAGVVIAAVLGMVVAAALWWPTSMSSRSSPSAASHAAHDGARTQRDRARLLLLPALADGRRHRADRRRHEAHAARRRRSAEARSGRRAARRRRASTCSRTSPSGCATCTRSTRQRLVAAVAAARAAARRRRAARARSRSASSRAVLMRADRLRGAALRRRCASACAISPSAAACPASTPAAESTARGARWAPAAGSPRAAGSTRALRRTSTITSACVSSATATRARTTPPCPAGAASPPA